MSKTVALVIAAAALGMGTATAAAESKSWAAVKNSIHGKANMVIGGNLTAARSTKVFQSALQLMLTEEPDAKRAFDMIKDNCKIDVPAAIADFTVVMKDGDNPLVVLALDNLNEAAMVACVEAIGAKEAGKAVKLTSKRKGKVTTYSVPGETDKLYFAWLAPTVVAFSEDPSAKGKLEKLLAGKAAKGTLAAHLAKVNSDLALWGAVAIKEKEDGMTMLGGYGGIELAGGKWNGNVHVVMSKPEEAQQAATMATMGLAEVKKNVKGTAVAPLINSLAVSAAGAEVEAKGTLADTDITTLIADFDRLF